MAGDGSGPQDKSVSTPERDLQHTNVAQKRANGQAQLNAGATAQQQKEWAYQEYRRLVALAKQRQQQAYDRTLAENSQYYKDHPWVYFFRKLGTGDDDMLEKEANAASFGRDQTSFLNPSEAATYNQAQKIIAGNTGGVAHAVGSGLVDGTGILSEEHPEGSKEDLHAQASTNEYPLARFLGMIGPGIFFGYRARRGGATPKVEPKPDPVPADPVPAGEPVSVATGEYLETWEDFFIPGTLGFDGARYMGLKLALPENVGNPLGPCQISMFDEVFSNPRTGELRFHQADGKVIPFERPFNFLPSTNPARPHLELKAPWLKQLVLKDRGIVKHFNQYDDDIYRLEQIDDLNGNSLRFERSEDGWLERIEGPDGLSLAFANDGQGRRLRITLISTDGSALELARYAYDARGRMILADCTYGVSVRYVWHDAEELLTAWHDVTRQSETRFSYDDTGRVIHTRTNGIWNGDRFDYGEGCTRYLPGGSGEAAQIFEYDENDHVTAEIDALGGVTAHRYDRAGFRIATRDANGSERRAKYDIHGNISEDIDAEGRTTTYVWGDDGELSLIIDGAGNRRAYEHDARANVIAETDAEGHVTRLARDSLGRVVEARFANGAVERRDWDDFNRLTSVTDAKGAVTRFAYDAFNRVTMITDALGQATRYEYHSGAGGFDMPSRITRADGVSVARGFDGQGQLASVTDGEGRTWLYRNGAFGILQDITDPKGGVTSFDYDIEGRLLSVTNALGRSYHYVRDAVGRVIEEEDFDGRITRYHRDDAGQVVEKIRPDGARLTFAYDKSGRMKHVKSFDAKGEAEDRTRFWYDARGLLVRTENRAALVELKRDRNGRIVAEVLNGKRIRSTRDALGNRVLREIAGLGGGPGGGPGASLVEYIRDPLGAVEKMVVGETEIAFRHDLLGRETACEIGGFGRAQRYDALGRMVAQTAGPKRPVDIGISRLGWNTPSGDGGTRRGTVARVYEYDRAFAPVRVDDGLWGETRFDYDDNGQLVLAEGAQGAECFTYDAARNLAGASSSAPFSVDGAGYGAAFDAAFGTATPAGRPSGWQRSAGGVVQIARGPKGERIGLKHDECGRLIERNVERDGFRPRRWRYRWDAQDRLVAVTQEDGEQWLFRYDPFNRRVSKVKCFAQPERERAARIWPLHVGGDGTPKADRSPSTHGEPALGCNGLPFVGTSYLWDGAHMIAEAPLRLDGHVAWEAAVIWHFEDGENNDDSASHRLLAKELPAGTKLPDSTVLEAASFFPIVCDHLGTSKEMFDQNGGLVWAADHHVWGELRAIRIQGGASIYPAQDGLPGALDCPWRFPGQYEDSETGLFYNRHRYYDALTGQYACSDPIGLAGGDRPQGYVEVATLWTDPLGLTANTPKKRGPKTDPNAPHNAKIRELGDKVVAEGGTIIAGGGRLPEIAVKTEGGSKSIRRPDIIYRDKNGVIRGINVGKVKADGITPVPREVEALNDLNKYWGPTTFVPYN